MSLVIIPCLRISTSGFVTSIIVVPVPPFKGPESRTRSEFSNISEER